MSHHHAIWFGPLLACVLLALLPAPLALATGTAALVGWLLLGSYAERSVRELPPSTGRESLLGRPVEVVAPAGAGWQVRCLGEVWSAVSIEPLRPGAHARVIGWRGMKPIVAGDVRTAPRWLSSLGEAQSGLRRALARLEWQIGQLHRAAETRERAARRVLPGDEAAARSYLAQRHLLMQRCAELQHYAEALKGELAEVERLHTELVVKAPDRRVRTDEPLPISNGGHDSQVGA